MPASRLEPLGTAIGRFCIVSPRALRACGLCALSVRGDENRYRLVPSVLWGVLTEGVSLAGGPDNQVHFEGYQVSNQCMALVRDECLLPCKDAPELGYVKESSSEQYVPDVFYKVNYSGAEAAATWRRCGPGPPGPGPGLEPSGHVGRCRSAAAEASAGARRRSEAFPGLGVGSSGCCRVSAENQEFWKEQALGRGLDPQAGPS